MGASDLYLVFNLFGILLVASVVAFMCECCASIPMWKVLRWSSNGINALKLRFELLGLHSTQSLATYARCVRRWLENWKVHPKQLVGSLESFSFYYNLKAGMHKGNTNDSFNGIKSNFILFALRWDIQEPLHQLGGPCGIYERLCQVVSPRTAPPSAFIKDGKCSRESYPALLRASSFRAHSAWLERNFSLNLHIFFSPNRLIFGGCALSNEIAEKFNLP